MENFSQRFEIIYKLYCEMAVVAGLKPSKLGLAKFLGISQGRMQSWENGQIPRPADIILLHDKFRLDFKWLMTGKGEPLAKDKAGQRTGDFAELEKENDLLKAELAEEKSFSRKLAMQNAELYEECKTLKEKLAFLEAGEVFAQSPKDAPSPQAGPNLSGRNEGAKKQ